MTSYRFFSSHRLVCARSELPGASDDPSSCVMVCVTPNAGLGFKDKGNAGAACLYNSTTRACLLASHSPQIISSSGGRGAGSNVLPINISDEL